MKVDVKNSKRHTCLICKKKRDEAKMQRFKANWLCIECINPEELPAADRRPGHGIYKALNLYAGIGGNRKFWPVTFSVTAVENNPKVAAAYKRLYPNDLVIVGDAHSYLLKHYFEFDFIWSSPPCQSHTRLNYIFKKELKRYPDMSLYQEIILLRNFYSGKWVIENVIPYYDDFIKPDYIIDRHYFWSNFKINNVKVNKLRGFASAKNGHECTLDELTTWLGIKLDTNIYLGAKNAYQVYRNCCHPDIGYSILKDAINFEKEKQNNIDWRLF